MWQDLITLCDVKTRDFGAQPPLERLSNFVKDITIEMQPFRVMSEDLPYGRYLLHQGEHFNIQIDVFSKDYMGSVHNHEAWGVFYVLKGALWAEDWCEVKGDFQMSRFSFLPEGSCQGFGPPLSDWHRVGTPDFGQQTVSLHIYGPGFDLDQGTYLNQDLKPTSSQRSLFKDMQLIERHIGYNV